MIWITLSSEKPRQLTAVSARMRAVKPRRTIVSRLRSALTIALVLWCAGAGCVIASYAHAAKTVTNAAQGSSAGVGHSSGLTGAHDCCKARHATERRVPSMPSQTSSSDPLANFKELAEVPNSSSQMSCCPLTSGSIVANASSRISSDDASESLGIDAASSVHNGYATTLQANSLRLPNQSHTYLRGCAFLI